MATSKKLVRFRLHESQVEELELLRKEYGLSKNELLATIVSDFLKTKKKKESHYDELIKEEAEKLRIEFEEEFLKIERRLRNGS